MRVSIAIGRWVGPHPPRRAATTHPCPPLASGGEPAALGDKERASAVEFLRLGSPSATFLSGLAEGRPPEVRQCPHVPFMGLHPPPNPPFCSSSALLAEEVHPRGVGGCRWHPTAPLSTPTPTRLVALEAGHSDRVLGWATFPQDSCHHSPLSSSFHRGQTW